jgi:hypothetical protein
MVALFLKLTGFRIFEHCFFVSVELVLDTCVEFGLFSLDVYRS